MSHEDSEEKHCGKIYRWFEKRNIRIGNVEPYTYHLLDDQFKIFRHQAEETMSSLHWTEAKLFKFLRLYKRYECLWNPYSPEYRKCDAKSEAFSHILYEMNVFGLTVNECLNKIKHIRETYKREQQRLENLAFLGARCHSNLLWYPLMNSMLSKVLQDEEKLNQETAGNSELVVVPKRLPINYGDEGNQSYLNRSQYGQRTVSWDHNETTICPYLPISNSGDHSDCYQSSIISNKCIEAYETNGHISSCPTCGYSNSCSCSCFSMNDIGYHSGNIGQGYCSSHPRINYRPRTSYNYRNGILEINSAVRIPVSQPSPDCGHDSNVIKRLMPNNPNCNYTPISNNYQPKVQTVHEEEEFSAECCAEYPDGKDEGNRMNRECGLSAILDNAANTNPNSPDLEIRTTSALTKNNNWSCNKFIGTKESIDEILCSRDLSASIDVAQNAICKSIKHENIGKDDEAESQVVDQENHTNDIHHSRRVDFEDSLDIKQEIPAFNPQWQRRLNIIKAEKTVNDKIRSTEANVKIEETSTIASDNEQPRKVSIPIKISQVKPECNLIHAAKSSQSKKCQTECELAEKRSGKIKTTGEDVINDLDENYMSDPESTQDLVQKARSIIKRNITKILIDFIDETLNKPDGKSTVNKEERLILKKVAKDLKALKNEGNHFFDDKLAMDNHQQSQQNHRIESCKKTICWREPVEESFNIIPCISTKFPANKTRCEKNCLAERPMQLDKGSRNCFRLGAGADFEIDSDMKETNLFSQTSTRKKNETTTTDDCRSFKNNHKKTIRENIISPTRKEHSMIFEDRKLQCNDENNGSQNIESEEQIITKESKSNTKICEDQINNLEGNSCFNLQDLKLVENSVMIHVSVETSGKTESEIIEKVVNKITRILRKTLESNGLAIEKKRFFTKKKLITHDNGEMNRKLIRNEDVWKTELRNIIRQLMKQKKIGDPITFKVKTMILPVTNQSKDNTPQEATNLASLTKPRQKRGGNRKELTGVYKSGANSQMRKDQFEISGDAYELLYRNGKKSNDEGNDKYEISIENSDTNLKLNRKEIASKRACELPSKKFPGKIEGRACNEQFTAGSNCNTKFRKLNREFEFNKQFFKNQIRRSTRKCRYIIPRYIMKNVSHLEKILFNDANQIISPYKDYPQAMSKLFKYLIQFGKTVQGVPKKTAKSLRSKLQLENQYVNQYKNDFIGGSFCDKLPPNLSQDIDVYLCTEISQEDQSSLQKHTVCDSLSDSYIHHDDVNECSLFTSTKIRKNSQMKGNVNSCMQKSESTSDQDVSDWKSFYESDEEAEISKNTVNTSTNTPKDAIWNPKHAKKADKRSNTVNQSTNKSYSIPSRANRSKNIPNSQNTCEIVNILSSDNQNISRNELQSSESLCCAEFEETAKPNESLIAKRTESEDGDSLLRAKLKVAADSRIRSCCTGDKTHSVCVPICDVTSRLRLCAILKSPNQTNSADCDILSNNMCCCDDMDKPKNIMTGDASVRLITTGCQSEPAERDLNILDSGIHESNQECREDSNKSFLATCDETCRKNAVVIDPRIVTLDEDVELPENTDRSRSTKRVTVQSDTQHFASTSLDIPDSKDGPLMLEIKMLQPLFSIEIKRGREDPEKKGPSICKQISCNCELLEQSNHGEVLSSREESVIESDSKNDAMSPEQQSIIETAHINSINCGGRNMTDQEAETFVQKSEEEAVSSGTQRIQICGMENDLKTEREVTCSDDGRSSAPAACIKIKENASTSLGGDQDCSTDPDECNTSLEAIGLLKNNEDPSAMNIGDFSENDFAACAEKAISQLKSNSSDVTQSRTLESLISTLETSLQHITDPIIRQRVTDTIQCIEGQDQRENYSSTEIHQQDQACGTHRKTLSKRHETDNVLIKSKLRLLTSKNSECQKSHKSEANSSKNIEDIVSHVTVPQHQITESEGMARNSQMRKQSQRGLALKKKENVADQLSTKDERRAMLPPVGKCYYQNKQSLRLMEQEKSLSGRACISEKARSKFPLSRSTSKLRMIKVEDSNNTSHENPVVSDDILQGELQGNRGVMSTFSYSSTEISCGVEEIEHDSINSCCNPNNNEILNVVPQLRNDQHNYESHNNHSCYYTQSTEQEINEFASLVASQLRELSTEAALRSQQRIQTLISNSRLKWEKNKKYR